MVLDTSLLNTRQYKVRIKGKVEQFWEILGVVAMEKGAFWSPSTKVADFTFTTIYKFSVNLINTLALKTLISQLSLKYLSVC